MHKTPVSGLYICRVISLTEELFLTISSLNIKWKERTQFFLRQGLAHSQRFISLIRQNKTTKNGIFLAVCLQSYVIETAI